MLHELSTWTYHQYTDKSHGWLGLLEDKAGDVRAFIAVDGQVVAVEDVTGYDENSFPPPYPLKNPNKSGE